MYVLSGSAQKAVGVPPTAVSETAFSLNPLLQAFSELVPLVILLAWALGNVTSQPYT